MLSRSFLTATCIALTGAALAIAQDAARPDDAPPRHIYVPVDDLDAVIDRDHGGVMLSRAEYDELNRAAQAGADGQPHLPDGAVLSQADYSARISDDQLLVTVTAALTSFQSGWSRVVLPAGGTGVESATLDGQPARLARDPEQPTALVLFLSEPGAHALTLELSTPLTAVGGDRAAAFELFGAPTGVLTLTLPAGKHLTVNAAQPERPAAVDAEANYALAVGGQKAIRLRISDRTAAATGDALTFAQSVFGVYVAPGEITWTARTGLQVYGRAIDTLVCTVPKSLELTAVDSSGLESWELGDAADAPDRTQITLHYRQAWDGAREITFRGIVAAPADSAWSVPDLTIQEITSHVGRAIVQFPPGVRLQMVDAVGIRPVLAVNGMDPSAPSLEYEVWQEAFRLSFLTAPKEREVHAAMTTLLDVNADGLDLSVTLDARTLFAPLFDLQFRIPAEWTVRSVSMAGAPVEWQVVAAEAGINQVQVPLNPPLAINESRSFTLVAHRDPEGWPVEQAAISFALPEVRLPQVGVIEALYGIAVDADLEVRPRDVAGLDPARQDDINLLNAKLAAYGKSIRLGYTFQDTVFSGQLDVTRRPSRVAASTVLFFRADRQSLFGHLESIIDVAGGGIRELQTSVSEAAGADLRFQLLQPITAPDGRMAFAAHSTRIVEQVPGEPQNGMRPWTLRFDQRLRGTFVLMADVQTPLAANPPAGDAAATADETFSPFVLTIVGADREAGHIAIESNGEQHVQVTSADAAGAALPTVDPVDFPPAVYQPAERVVAGFRYAQPGWTMTIRRTEYDRQPVPTAVIHNARLTSVVSETGEMQNQADYTFTAVGVQSLRLRLTQNDDGTPPELWSVLIDGEPVEVRTSSAGQLIALPPAASPQAARTLRLSYRSVVPPLDKTAGRLHQSPPTLVAVTGAGEEQPLEILEQTWTVHHAQETLLVDSEGRFHPSDELDRDSFLGRLEQWLQAPSPKDLLWGAIAIAAAIVAACVLSLGYRRASVVGVVLALLVLGCVLIVLLLPATQQAREASVASARFQDVSGQSFRSSGSEMPLAVQPPVPASAPSDAPMQQGGAMGEALQMARPDAPPQAGESQSEEMRFDFATELNRPQVDRFMRENESAPAAGGMGGMPLQSSSESGLTPLAPFGAVTPDQPEPAQLQAGQQGGSGNDGEGVANMPAETLGVGMGGGDFDQLQSLVVPTTGRGALLSLTLDLQPPPGYVQRNFTYRGDATDDAPADLNLIYASRRAGRTLMFVVAAGAILLCWVCRRCPVVERLWLAALLLIAPLALMTVMPAIWLPILDGL
ncbi:MAG: hypothetical protein JNG89_20910, partial [Planctomycetaceae bacterium]|nr:hypothetical protein [Planctomycetaceae bacterium]